VIVVDVDYVKRIEGAPVSHTVKEHFGTELEQAFTNARRKPLDMNPVEFLFLSHGTLIKC
jgi:hypothetical protein